MGEKAIGNAIEYLLEFSVRNGLLPCEDVSFARNLMLDALHLSSPPVASDKPINSRGDALHILSSYAADNGFASDLPSERERFETRLMGLLTPSPEAFRNRFYKTKLEFGLRRALKYYVSLCEASRYINEEELARNVRFFAPSEFGELEITINVSKPEKDPREIAAILTQKNDSTYPPCMLCADNEGYAGRLGMPARQTLRTLPIYLAGEPWRFQFSPYKYFTEHCIALAEEHAPMKIDRNTFIRLIDFLSQFPHYMIGSNADLPIVGGSVLNHNHFQGGDHTFAMEKSGAFMAFAHPSFARVKAETLGFAMSTIKLTSEDSDALVEASNHILETWKSYDDELREIHAYTSTTPHNTITPIARKKGTSYAMYLILRNNRTTTEHPLGIFHPHADLHHVKKENIGLIEAMGMFILPGRLLPQLDEIKRRLTCKTSFVPYEESNPMSLHNDWIGELTRRFDTALTPAEAEDVVRGALTQKCARVLSDSAVFKQTEDGRFGFVGFMEHAGFMKA